MAKITVAGSCVSRVILLDGKTDGHGIADEDMELEYFLDKQNIICSMMPAPFTRSEVESIEAEELYNPQTLRTLKQGLNKEMIKRLLESDAEYLILDFYDLQVDFCIYNNTTFSNCAHEFFNTKLFEKYKEKIQISNFMDLPAWLWYSYADLFFESIRNKFDSDHIILNRFWCNEIYLDKDGECKKIPDVFKQPWHAHTEYNNALHEFEEYIIQKYNPYVIDLSKYFMTDANLWSNWNGAHFEREFYRESFKQIKRIVKGMVTERYFDKPAFFDSSRQGYKEDRTRAFNVEAGIEMFYKLLEENNLLWMNILDKLFTYASEDKRVLELMECLQSISN